METPWIIIQFLKAPTGFILDLRPMTNSLIIIGTATIKTKKEVQNKKSFSSSAAGSCHVRKLPYVSKTNGRTKGYHQCSESRTKSALFFVSNDNKISP